MLRLRRILFPTDFSPCAEDAFSHAAHLAVRYDAEVHVFNVVTPKDADHATPMDYLPITAGSDGSAASDGMVTVQTPLDEDAQVRVTYEKAESVSPAEAIVNRASDDTFDLIVMGTHGRRGVERLLSGSVSEEVVRQAPCPVFTVLSKDDEPSPGPYVRRVLAPVDLSEQSALIVDHAAELASAYDARLDLVHVVEQAAYPDAYGVDPLAMALPEVQDRAHDALQTLADRAAETVDVEMHTRIGYAAHDIVDFSNEKESDLIVMATHGRTGLKRFLIGSVTEKVIRTASCPVFTLKSFGRSLLASDAEEADASAEA